MENNKEESKIGKFLWIYGAGIVANKFLDFVEKGVFDVQIAGIVVSNREGNPKELRGYQVSCLSELTCTDEESTFLLAVSPQIQDEVTEELHNHGYFDLIFWRKQGGLVSWTMTPHHFEDRRRGAKKVCFLLGGYKEFLWEDIHKRICMFLPEDVEMCLLSSGTYSDTLATAAKAHGWSYLSTTINSVTLIQNLAMELFLEAEYIYKMDEDIFLTEGCFERTLAAMQRAKREDYYRIGVAAPLINVNAYCYIRILKALGKLECYEKSFEHPLYGGDNKKKIECDPKAAAFMWGMTGELPTLDTQNAMWKGQERYSFCGVRFSIGFILFTREFWEAMGGFDVSGSSDMGGDEGKIISTCAEKSFGFLVAEDTVVGHFSFGKQTEKMREYYEKNPSYFAIQ